MSNILWLHDLRLSDLAQVGGKNSSLGEMIGNLAKLGVSVPGGFATTADAFKAFIAHNDLHQRIFDRLAPLDVEDVAALTAAGKEIRGWVIDAPLQPDLDADIRAAYEGYVEIFSRYYQTYGRRIDLKFIEASGSILDSTAARAASTTCSGPWSRWTRTGGRARRPRCCVPMTGP